MAESLHNHLPSCFYCWFELCISGRVMKKSTDWILLQLAPLFNDISSGQIIQQCKKQQHKVEYLKFEHVCVPLSTSRLLVRIWFTLHTWLLVALPWFGLCLFVVFSLFEMTSYHLYPIQLGYKYFEVMHKSTCVALNSPDSKGTEPGQLTCRSSRFHSHKLNKDNSKLKNTQ